MDKQEYLKRLKNSMSSDLNEKEIREILEDYSEYFINGANTGKSDAQICKQLGPPEALGKTIISGLSGSEIKKGDKLKKIRFKRVAIGFVFILLLFYVFKAYQVQVNVSRDFNIIAGILLITVIPYLLLNIINGNEYLKGKKNISNFKTLSYLSLVPVLCGLIGYISNNSWRLISNYLQLEEIGPMFIMHIIFIISIILTASMLLVVFCLYKKSCFIGLIYFLFGIIAFLCEIIYSLQNVAEPKYFIFYVTLSSYFIIISIPISVGMIFYYKKMIEKC